MITLFFSQNVCNNNNKKPTIVLQQICFSSPHLSFPVYTLTVKARKKCLKIGKTCFNLCIDLNISLNLFIIRAESDEMYLRFVKQNS